MDNVKKTIGENLAYLRKNAKLTQAELAEKLGYSDKAISTWENGTALPDAETLTKIAEFYHVDMNFIFSPDTTKQRIRRMDNDSAPSTTNRQKILIISFLVTLVWLLAAIIYTYLYIYLNISESTGDNPPIWMAWIWAIPVSFVAITLLVRFYWKSTTKLTIFIFGSLATWTGLVAVCLQAITLGTNIWVTMVIGVPIEIMLLIWLGLGNRMVNRTNKKEKESTKS
ncbi:MAG: helix-turn-helix domain-containing protein [Coprobacillus sp.]|nr:helix-turn-helix domain-containing protein [Coprobacillus sp.]